MEAPVDSFPKQSMELKIPMLTDGTVPKKDHKIHKVLVIKLPLDIDIRIHRERHYGTIFSLLTFLVYLVVPIYFMFTYNQQLRELQYEIAELSRETSKIAATGFQLSALTKQILDNALTNLNKSESVNTSTLKQDQLVHRNKRDTVEGQNVAIKADNELNYTNEERASNETMRGNVKTQRQLRKRGKPGIGYGAVRAAHFKGLFPEKVVEAGQIGPWYEDQQAVGDFGLRSCNLRDRGVKLAVNETGLYLIYAQVYYLTSKSLNSFSINVNPGNKGASIPVAFCSANAALNDQEASEVSCFTSIVRKLQAGDAISLQQQERQRRLVMREGHSFVGLVRLS